MTEALRTTALHAALTFRSEETAEAVFGDLFGMPRLKTVDIGPDLCGPLFGLQRSARLIQYDGGPAAFEVFIDAEAPPPAPRYEHICVAVTDMASTVARAEALGLEVRRFVSGAKEVIFLADPDGNLYELKPKGS